MKLWIPISILIAYQINQCFSLCQRRGTECIDYDVIAHNSEYEERQYPATIWVSVSTKGTSLSRAQGQLFKKLFRYIQGDNLKGAFINSTTPTRTKVEPCQEDTLCEHTYTMSFLIPQEIHEDIPIPTNVELFLEREAPKRYLVRSFGGRPTEAEWLNQAQTLADFGTKEDGVAQDHYYLNWYDPPLQLFKRLNEVWLSKDPFAQLLPLEQESNQQNEIC